ncbi:ribosome-associated GTPase EngA [Candidatus Karelsulcia muelleri DMIN]|uniref:GTPase Der n=2 Tax=Candidatus Karelsulcia muelleri TaxID=336810 RepID=DER_KARMG|nr:RecName: Full=GTPase Der; AltName: Full=GTP-binding protein EngA [Candidatus Karelsulcia muelleri GWSS]ABS30559.1 GTP-binding protein EngA [Candidatus Karelsulcia muelleri GWSS]ADE35435.1 ribosome-associated GTPase EngA [Candidatus Karelsulcia muelleri DMIN]MCJ7468827.1 ribosome biogenesis GTPase Der [Candidatus Karelsulcia muelleri]
MTKIVSIVGRPNVGKSTLFNRIIGYKKSIVNSKSGITRDRNYGFCNWNGIEFCLIDTGGYTNESKNIFDKKICEQFLFALAESDVILFLVDPSNDILGIDYDISKRIRKLKKSIYLVINKIDIYKNIYNTYKYCKFGITKTYCISSINGTGTEKLLDSIVSNFDKNIKIYKKNIPRIAIVGRPNVGKSTLINTLLNKNKNIVTNISGTTRDSIDVLYSKFGIECILVDTAGIRKKKNIKEDIEFYSVMRAIKSIQNSDVSLLIIDSKSGFESQDINIFKIIENNNKGIVLLINKWDIFNNNYLINSYENKIKKIIAPFNDVPIFFTSSFTKKDIIKSIKTAVKITFNLRLRIKTSLLNKIILPILNKNPHPSINGKLITIKYCSQIQTYNPQFIFFTNYPNNIKESYKRFIENNIREKFNFTGIPIKILFRLK